MDKSRIAKVKVALTAVYGILAIISVICEMVYKALFSSNFDLASRIFDKGMFIGMLVMVVLPILLVPVNFVISLIGMIKNRKVLPYLLCIPVSVIFWIITTSVYGRYI